MKKTFSKSKSVGYKKIRTRALDGYAGLSRKNILTVTLNDAEFKKFTVKFTNKTASRPVTAIEVNYLYIYNPIFIFISSTLTEETFVTETFARSKNPLGFLVLKRFRENISLSLSVCLSVCLEWEKTGIYVYQINTSIFHLSLSC